MSWYHAFKFHLSILFIYSFIYSFIHSFIHLFVHSFIYSLIHSVIHSFSHTDAVGLNCGCPQRWAIADGYGCYLLTRPELICDMVKQTKQRVGNDFPVEIKIRIDKNEK